MQRRRNAGATQAQRRRNATKLFADLSIFRYPIPDRSRSCGAVWHARRDLCGTMWRVRAEKLK